MNPGTSSFDWPYRALADAVLLLHAGIVVFVVGAVVLIVAGNRAGWAWVNGLVFRGAHAVAIAIVVAQAWLGQTCPLTVLEVWLRRQAGEAGFEAGFIEHWVQRLLYYDAPAWVFVAAYTAFGMLVLWVWWIYPPRRLRTRR